MKLIRGLHNLQQPLPGCVATIGNFDGMHLGHQHVINQLKSVAEIKGLPSVVILFEPQPVEFFAPDKAPRRLSRLRDKIIRLSQIGVDCMLCLRFDQKFADLTADQFVQQVLIDKLNIRHLVIGDDFRFGRNRAGDFAFLQQRGHEAGFEVESWRPAELQTNAFGVDGVLGTGGGALGGQLRRCPGMNPGLPAVVLRQFDGGLGVGAGAAALLKSVFQRI